MDALQRFSLVGLPNVGNSCYMNSTLQMLATILPFREKIIRRYAQNRQCPTQCLGAEVQRSVARHVLHGDLTGQQLRSLRNSMYENSGGSFVKPENGSPWPQEDANECLQILLKGLDAAECSVCQVGARPIFVSSVSLASVSAISEPRSTVSLSHSCNSLICARSRSNKWSSAKVAAQRASRCRS